MDEEASEAVVVKTTSKEAVNLASRSQMRNFSELTWSASSIEWLRACWITHSATGLVVMPAIRTRRVSWWMNARTWSLRRRTVSTWKKSHAISPFAWAARSSAQVGPDPRGAGSTPWRFKIAETLEGAMAMPMRASSPWMRR